MRVKTEAKRDEILKAAAVEFSLRGFHATTLAHVAERMASSKATIYNYFPTKGELFGSMLAAEAVPARTALLDLLKGDEPLRNRLEAFARAFILQQTGERPIAIQRLLIAESAKSTDAMRPLHEAAVTNGLPHVAEIFHAEQRAGSLNPGDTTLMVRQLCALLQGDLPLMLLFGARAAITPDEIDASASSAVDMFLAAYGVRS